MSFDPAAATAAYIDSLGPEALAKAAAYTSGSHWLLLWGLLVSALATWVIVRLGWLDRLQARLGARRNWAAFLVSAATFALLAILTLPWSLWTDFFRERAYGRTSQPLADWLGQWALASAITVMLAGLFFMGVYALIRRARGRWWLWASGLAAVAVTALLLAGPVFIAPLFNQYTPLPEGPVRTALEAQAIEAGVPTDRIFVYDGSRQSNNFTANVSGIFGSARIAISDVALKGADLDEVEAVTGHEIGHYVLGHVWRSVALLVGLALIFFFLIDRLYPRFAALFGSSAALDQPAGLPVILFMASLFGLLATPLQTALTRQGEREADRYSLETVGKPDALARALVKTADYRDPRPHPIAEALFMTHPSVERRVRAAMEWKAANATRDAG
ncbi:MAG: M48 family metallopeptidase [Sphingomonadaceae bacterium]